MITNERQYKITKNQRNNFLATISSYDLNKAKKIHGSEIIAQAELDALKSEYDILEQQIHEYELLKSGICKNLIANSIEDLSILLIKARIIRGFSQKELAQLLGIKEQQIQRYESEKYFTASLKRISEIANALKLNISEVAELKEINGVIPTKEQDEQIWSKLPVKEMYSRGWFSDFTGTLKAALSNAEELITPYIDNCPIQSSPALLRQRSRIGGHIDPYALLAWQCRVSYLAQSTNITTIFSPERLDDVWFKELTQLSIFKDGPIRAQKHLHDSGIPLIIEPHLPKTHLDGAAILLPNGTPFIALTLRYDRLDNFWFVLLHELVHVRDHLHLGQTESIFDNLEDDQDPFEQETDKVAGEILLPDEIWETALPRYVLTEESVIEFASDLKIHPSIVAGRIRKESDNYTIMGSLIGQGEVRKYFEGINFT